MGALALLLLAATLGAIQPARGFEFDPPAATAVPTMTTNADDLIVTFALKPNQPGRNFVSLGVFDTRRPAPASSRSCGASPCRSPVRPFSRPRC